MGVTFIDVNFQLKSQGFTPSFGVVQRASDGGFEQGYEAGYTKGYADGHSPSQEKAVELTENGSFDVFPDNGYLLSKVTVKTNVEGSGGGEFSPVATSLIRKSVGYIDTGVDGANSNLTIEMRYEFISMPSGYWNMLRAYVDETTNSTRIIYNRSQYVYCCLNSIPSQSLSSTGYRYAGVVYTDILKPENSTTFSYTYNGSKSTKVRTSGSPLSGANIILFPTSSNPDGVYIKVYYLKIFDGETIVRDFVPFITSDGECGLYDKVTQQFYGNAGSGTFEAETISFMET